jgi:tetratricopeptide (TPR) repeat protein
MKRDLLSRAAAVAVACALSLTAAAAQEPEGHQHTTTDGSPAGKALVFDDLGSYHRGITTGVPEAQRYFDQGLRLFYAFNLEEAQRSFEAAAQADSACAMCSWGVAMSLGPHINFPAQAERTKAAHVAAQRAASLAGPASPVEKGLIAAVVKRYSDPPPADSRGQAALDKAYADAMRDVARRFPDDLDAGALFAEAMMNLRPWDLWTLDGKAQPGTEEILATLEAVLAKDPLHPGANHYYIHAIEASPHPEKALAAAGRLASLIPGAAHIVHMPSHIYARVGRWEDAAEANRKAIAVDRDYLAKAGPLGFYFMYVAHNYQFLWSAALMEGRSAEALESARATVGQAPVEMLRQMPGFDFILGYPAWTLIRFGRWEEALAEAAPPAGFPYAEAVWRAARGLALAELGRLDEAEAERAKVAATAAATPLEAMQGLSSARSLLAVAEGLVAGKIAARRGDFDKAVRLLTDAVETEDHLRYNEPPDWYWPARHELGAVLLQAGRAAAAQKVWEEDLERNPDNGWALAGLAASLRAQKKEKEAAVVSARLAKAWARADVPAPGSRGKD